MALGFCIHQDNNTILVLSKNKDKSITENKGCYYKFHLIDLNLEAKILTRQQKF